jgi:hypothetical protein
LIFEKQIVFLSLVFYFVILLYGAETWTLNTQQANKLLATEMDFWRRSARNQGKKRSEMSPLERSWRWGRTF